MSRELKWKDVADPAMEERVRYYMRQMQAGKPTPAMVLYRLPGGTFITIGKNSLCKLEAATRLGVDNMGPAYVIEDATQEQLDSLARKFDEHDFPQS
jgi:hypothetical protein